MGGGERKRERERRGRGDECVSTLTTFRNGIPDLLLLNAMYHSSLTRWCNIVFRSVKVLQVLEFWEGGYGRGGGRGGEGREGGRVSQFIYHTYSFVV